MKCVICKSGDTEDGYATVTLNRDQSTIIIKGVPAQVCENCGEYYLNEDISTRVMELAENAIKHNAEVEILRFAAGVNDSKAVFMTSLPNSSSTMP